MSPSPQIVTTSDDVPPFRTEDCSGASSRRLSVA
jgi:hypothetical protein